MKVRRNILKTRTIILLAGAMAFVAGSTTGAAAADMFTKAPQADMGWYFHGGFDAGGRFYAERPGSGFGYDGYDPAGPTTAASRKFLLPTQTDSRAKYEEYGKIPPGLFLDWINMDFGSNDGRYRVNIWGHDVGYNAQSYSLDFSEAGKQYLTLEWDQTPHLWSYSAKSLFSGVGTTTLTVPNAVQDQLQALWGTANNTLGSRQDINNIINQNATQIDELSVRRDKFSAAYRYTPTPNWDFNVSYSHEHREGTKPGALNYSYQANANTGAHVFPGNSIGVPYPIDDTTQTPKASGEYDGSGAWGRYSFKLAYAGSIYHDDLTLLTVDNPYSNTGAQLKYGTLRVVLPPSNQAHAFTGSGAFDIPVFHSRFTTTNQYARQTQNQAFIDTSNNGLTQDPMPASSLDGEVNNFLTNNVLTSSFTSTLHNKVRVRYFEHKNNTTILDFGQVVHSDTEQPVVDPPEYTSYNKTNLDEDLTWNPAQWFTIGVGYGYERWNRSDNRFATRTDENIFRMFANTQVTDWAQWRVSYSYGARRYLGEYEIPPDSPWNNQRMFDLANRNQHKARTLLDIAVTDAITVTPTAGLRWTDYPDDAVNQTGLHYDHSWNAGVDVGFAVSPALRLMAGYNFAHDQMNISAAVPNGTPATCNPASGTVPATCIWNDTLSQNYHTLIASADWKAIPDTLDFRVRYAASWSREAHDFTPCSLNDNNCNGGSTNPAAVGLPWPDNTNLHQRLDATARYYFDKDTVRRMGWKGKIIAKLRYTWEKNHGVFWQNDNLEPYAADVTTGTDYSGAYRSTFLAYDNPNYTVQLIAASLIFKW